MFSDAKSQREIEYRRTSCKHRLLVGPVGVEIIIINQGKLAEQVQVDRNFII